jgi:hypothetical protein
MRARDEIEPPELHQWLCICRQLMFERPIDGAWLMSPRFTEGAYMRPGWNKDVPGDGRPPTYLYFDPETEHVDRQLFPPDGVDESCPNVIRPTLPTDIRQLPVWESARDLAARLSDGPMPLDLARPQSTMSEIARYAALKRGAKEIVAVSKPIISSVISGVDLGKGRGPDPAYRVTQDYMRFALPGIVARHMLSSIYEVCYTVVPNMFGRACQPATTMLVRKAEDLASAAYRLRTKRSEHNAAGYFNSTYLAALCAGTVITMCSNDGGRLDRLQFSNEQRQRLALLQQNLDELNAHYLGPAFLLPAQLSTAGVLRWIAAMAKARGKSADTVAVEQCLHPTLIALLAESDCEQLDELSVHARYVRNLAVLPHLSSEEVLQREAVAVRVNLHDFVLN